MFNWILNLLIKYIIRLINREIEREVPRIVEETVMKIEMLISHLENFLEVKHPKIAKIVDPFLVDIGAAAVSGTEAAGESLLKDGKEC